MSEHAAAAYASTQRAPAEQRAADSVTEHRTWPIAAIFFPSVVAAYAVVVGAVYLLVTSMSWQLLAAAGLVILLFNFVLLFVLMLRTMGMERTRHVSAITAQRDS